MGGQTGSGEGHRCSSCKQEDRDASSESQLVSLPSRPSRPPPFKLSFKHAHYLSFSQVGDRLIPVGITSSRDPLAPLQLGPDIGTDSDAGSTNSRSGRRGSRRGREGEITSMLQGMGIGMNGPDIEEVSRPRVAGSSISPRSLSLRSTDSLFLPSIFASTAHDDGGDASLAARAREAAGQGGGREKEEGCRRRYGRDDDGATSNFGIQFAIEIYRQH